MSTTGGASPATTTNRALVPATEIHTPPMSVPDYNETSYFNALRFTAMTRSPGSSFHDALVRRTRKSSVAWEQRCNYKGGKVMQTIFTVVDDVETK